MKNISLLAFYLFIFLEVTFVYFRISQHQLFFCSQWPQPSSKLRSRATLALHLCFIEPSLGLQLGSLWASVSPHFIEELPQDWNKWDSVLRGYRLAHAITSLTAEAPPSPFFCHYGVWLDGPGPEQCPRLTSSRVFPGCFAKVIRASGAGLCLWHSIPNK